VGTNPEHADPPWRFAGGENLEHAASFCKIISQDFGSLVENINH